MCKNCPDCKCLEFPAVSPSDLLKYRLSRGMTQKEFADHFGMTLKDVVEMEGSVRKDTSWISKMMQNIKTLIPPSASQKRHAVTA